MRVKPKDGLQIRCPITKEVIPADGYDVPDDSSYWTRRMRDGDVVQVVTSAGSKATQASSTASATSTGDAS